MSKVEASEVRTLSYGLDAVALKEHPKQFLQINPAINTRCKKPHQNPIRLNALKNNQKLEGKADDTIHTSGADFNWDEIKNKIIKQTLMVEPCL